MSAAPAPSPANPFSPEALAAKALEYLGVDAPTTDSILRVAAQLAVFVNKAPELHGLEKSTRIQQVLREVINMPAVRSKLSDEATSAINAVIDTVLPTTLALIVSAGRGEFDLKKVVPVVVPAKWSWCCSKRAVAVKVDTVSAEKGTGSVVVAEVAVEAPVTPPAEAEVVVDANSAPTESENLTPAP